MDKVPFGSEENFSEAIPDENTMSTEIAPTTERIENATILAIVSFLFICSGNRSDFFVPVEDLGRSEIERVVDLTWPITDTPTWASRVPAGTI